MLAVLLLLGKRFTVEAGFAARAATACERRRRDCQRSVLLACMAVLMYRNRCMWRTSSEER